MPILYSCHPRSRKFIEQRGFTFDERVIQHQPLGFHDYNHLQMNAFAVVSDSGTLPEESSYFLSIGYPSLLFVSVRVRSVPRLWTRVTLFWPVLQRDRCCRLLMWRWR